MAAAPAANLARHVAADTKTPSLSETLGRNHALSTVTHSSLSSISSLSSLRDAISLYSTRQPAITRFNQLPCVSCSRAPPRALARAASCGADRGRDSSANSGISSITRSAASSKSSRAATSADILRSSRHRRLRTVSANGEAANFVETSAAVVPPARRIFGSGGGSTQRARRQEQQINERSARRGGFLERDAEALAVREARPEEYWEAADVHCAAFFPHAPFPLNYILRWDRVSAILANLSMPRGMYKKCLVAFDLPGYIPPFPPPFAFSSALPIRSSSSPSSSSSSSSPSPSPSAPSSSLPSTSLSLTKTPITRALAPLRPSSPAFKDFDGEKDLFGGPMLRPVLATMLLGPPVLSWTFSGLNVGPRGIVGSVTVDTAGEFLPRRKPSNRRRMGIAYISNMAVRAVRRRRGVAGRLLAEAEAQARGWGCRSAALHCDVNNKGALQLYLQHGYRLIQPPLGAVWPQPMASEGQDLQLFMKRL